MYARRRNAGQPRMKRCGIAFPHSVHTVTSPTRREMHQVFGHHLRLLAEVPCRLRIKYQNRRGGVLSELVRSGMVVWSQALKSAVWQFPIDCVGTSPAPLAAMQAFILAHAGIRSNLASPNDEAARGWTWAEAHHPFAGLRACPDLWLACCQRHQPMINAWGHSTIVLQNVAQYSCHDRIVSMVRRSHSRARSSSPMSATNSWPRATILSRSSAIQRSGLPWNDRPIRRSQLGTTQWRRGPPACVSRNSSCALLATAPAPQ